MKGRKFQGFLTRNRSNNSAHFSRSVVQYFCTVFRTEIIQQSVLYDIYCWAWFLMKSRQKWMLVVQFRKGTKFEVVCGTKFEVVYCWDKWIILAVICISFIYKENNKSSHFQVFPLRGFLPGSLDQKYLCLVESLSIFFSWFMHSQVKERKPRICVYV